jgi:hypothetical protein
MSSASPTRSRRLPARVRCAATAVVLLVAAACGGPGDGADRDAAVAGLPRVPAGPGALSMTEVAYAVGPVVHVGDDSVTFPRPVEAWVRAQGRVWALLRDGIWTSDGGDPGPIGYDAGSLFSSASGDLLGFVDRAHGEPWRTVVLDLVSGRPVIADATGMGDADDDLTDLYEDAEPGALGFDDETLLVEAAESNAVLAFDPDGDQPTDLGDDAFVFGGGEPRVGRRVGVVVRDGRVVQPADPIRARALALLSPDGAITVVDDGDRTRLHDTGSGELLPLDLGADRLVLGGWTGSRTLVGARFDGNRPGAVTELVACEVPPYGAARAASCELVEEVATPGRQQVLFATGRRDLL